MNQEPLIDLEIVQTCTKSWKIIFPFDISGCILFFTVKKCANDTDENAVISKTIEIPYDSDSEAGITWLNILSEDSTIPVANYVYNILFQRNSSGGAILQRIPIGIGIFRVNLSETQRTS